MQDWILAVICILSPVALCIVGVRYVHKVFSTEVLARHNDIAAPLHAAVSVIYAVLLGFIVITVWEEYNDIELTASTEANQIVGINRELRSITGIGRESLTAPLTEYTRSVITKEWDVMESGEVDSYHSIEYKALWDSMFRFKPVSDEERSLRDRIFDHMNDLDGSRNERMLYSERQLPFAMWLLLTVGGVVLIFFSCALGAENRRIHVLMVCSLSVTIGIMLFIISAIDDAFSGFVRIEPEAYRHALDVLTHM
jgi:hypothetical protein